MTDKTFPGKTRTVALPSGPPPPPAPMPPRPGEHYTATDDRGLAALARAIDQALTDMTGEKTVAELVLGPSGRFSPDGGLDAAWAEVEAALPEGWWMQLDTGAGRIRAMAGEPVWNPAYQRVDVVGDTPAAALRALAAALAATPKEEQG